MMHEVLSLPRQQVHQRRVVVVVPDGTRALPSAQLLDMVLPQLQAHDPASLEVLVALGLHRPMSNEELYDVARVCNGHQVRLSQHTAHVASNLATLPSVSVALTGALASIDIPVVLHRALVEADTIVCLGLVEPHQYAGFSGGSKGIAIGCAGAETIATLHGLELLREPMTTLVETRANPFRRALDAVASRLDATLYGVHVVPSHPTPSIHQGPLNRSFEEAIEAASSTLLRYHARTHGCVHIVVEGAKSANFYQASRAATYVGLVHPTILEQGATILLEASCLEGFGVGAGELVSAQMFARGEETLLAELRGERALPARLTLEGGAQRAYVLAKLLESHRLVLIGARHMPELVNSSIRQFDTIQEALRALDLCDEEPLELRDVFHALPIHRPIAAT